MASFSEAYKVISWHEGGYAKVANDIGGETYKGISRKNWPKWAGWSIIDKVSGKKNGYIINDPKLNELVQTFYLVNFWSKMKGDAFKSQRVATFILDWYVNSGGIALKMLQKALYLYQDGAVGPATITATNAADEAVLMDKLIAMRTDFVEGIVRNNPSQKKFLAGWKNRINSFK